MSECALSQQNNNCLAQLKAKGEEKTRPKKTPCRT